MTELIQKYLERFNESFPLYMVMGMEDEEVEEQIKDCLDRNTPYCPKDSDAGILY